MDLNDLVAIDDLGMTLLVGDGRGVRISWVHSTDMPQPGPYLSGGELILTTGLWHRGPDDAAAFVGSVQRAGAAAVGYGVEQPDALVPEDVVQACRDARMPLLRVPHELPFMRVARAYHAAAGIDEQRDMRQSLEVHERLSAAAARGGGMSTLVRALSSCLPQPVWVMDGPEVVWAGESQPGMERTARTWGRGRQAAAFPVQARLRDGSAIAILRVDQDSPARSFLGYAQSVGSLASGERRALEDALPYLRSELARTRERRGNAAERQRDLLRLVERGDPADHAAEGLLRTPDSTSSWAVAVLLYPSVPVAVADSLLDALPAAVGGDSQRVEVVPGATEAVVALDLGETDAPEEQRAAKLLITRVLESAERQLDRSAHLGWCFLRHPDGVPGALTAARRAARLASAGGAGARLAQYESMGTHEMLLGLADDVMRAFEDLVVGPLLDHDARHGSFLVATLQEFLDRNCAFQPTAKALDIHVNTLRYRLATIERLTGRDLRSMPHKVDLFLALRSRADRRPAAP